MPRITKISKATDPSKLPQDRTDWGRVYQKPQDTVDQEATMDSENPVIKDGKTRRLNNNK
ncbi:hypothetical protein MJO52_05350 [Microbulbifer variabilis]|uniref:Uncharacterized protein n=1 Tax=Microbulbifer variabilis TaxID=266805 RepID=A0ABY4VEC5_9GAMM|nr:hypothetical protein [Microbulbifer variabilis]USD22559.1 hypothetical protein MJO52_05350 [Microbulbifer variabilis]